MEVGWLCSHAFYGGTTSKSAGHASSQFEDNPVPLYTLVFDGVLFSPFKMSAVWFWEEQLHSVQPSHLDGGCTFRAVSKRTLNIEVTSWALYRFSSPEPLLRYWLGRCLRDVEGIRSVVVLCSCPHLAWTACSQQQVQALCRTAPIAPHYLLIQTKPKSDIIPDTRLWLQSPLH